MEKKEKMVIHGNEFYEIDLECIRRRQAGKKCEKTEDSARKHQSVQREEKNDRRKKR